MPKAFGFSVIILCLGFELTGPAFTGSKELRNVASCSFLSPIPKHSSVLLKKISLHLGHWCGLVLETLGHCGGIRGQSSSPASVTSWATFSSL